MNGKEKPSVDILTGSDAEQALTPDDARRLVRALVSHTVRPEHDQEGAAEWVLRENLPKIVREGGLIVAKVGDVVAGMIGHTLLTEKDGRPVYVLEHLIVDPAFERQGIMKMLLEGTAEVIRAVAPDAFLYAGTRNPTVGRANERLGMKLVTPEQVCTWRKDIEDPERFIARSKQEDDGWKIYFGPLPSVP
jgi:GNAT superfamily N-acetyltransferase